MIKELKQALEQELTIIVIKTDRGYVSPAFDLTGPHEIVEGLRLDDVPLEYADTFKTVGEALIVMHDYYSEEEIHEHKIQVLVEHL